MQDHRGHEWRNCTNHSEAQNRVGLQRSGELVTLCRLCAVKAAVLQHLRALPASNEGDASPRTACNSAVRLGFAQAPRLKLCVLGRLRERLLFSSNGTACVLW